MSFFQQLMQGIPTHTESADARIDSHNIQTRASFFIPSTYYQINYIPEQQWQEPLALRQC